MGNMVAKTYIFDSNAPFVKFVKHTDTQPDFLGFRA